MSLDIDGRLEKKKLELYEKHGLDGAMSDEEVANKIRSLSSNMVRQQLLNDFKVQLNGLTINGNYHCWGCQAIIGLAALATLFPNGYKMRKVCPSKIILFFVAEK